MADARRQTALDAAALRYEEGGRMGEVCRAAYEAVVRAGYKPLTQKERKLIYHQVVGIWQTNSLPRPVVTQGADVA